ncbi:hypothetical protein [Mycobacteroides abscessus]|uniref:DUF732 domain-containing protein n=1 Tax=Mycobacteroides abscessus subsp. massiliense TaxID=1962118 RepID=A0A1T8KIF9_9MYCO|nr:hypothetical protein [Mycobacteroides abscessus]SKL82327.1 Uncharacterised protein [Mycobacteroides abscessus subsp. massiliense]SKS92553.1 Uncharacterised protein [Mycobacteroides abscessus subsp. massiliense]SKT19542.1 Uncharacterised protein [Mycobacteroides abscessus subsp. massiliense]SKW82037.1 Uncharacterised protein [Mycobacteroides abscessus subsp. massiliense]
MIRLLSVVVVAFWLGMASAAPVAADPANDAAKNVGGALCIAIGADPTFKGLNRIGEALHQRGFSYPDAGRVVRLSVDAYCPWQQPLLDLYVKSARWRTA